MSAVVIVEWAKETSVRATCTCTRGVSARLCLVAEARTGCLPLRRRVAVAFVAFRKVAAATPVVFHIPVAPVHRRVGMGVAGRRASCLVGWEA